MNSEVATKAKATAEKPCAAPAAPVKPSVKPVDAAKRNTIQRSLVLDAVRSMHTHPTSAEVYDAVRKTHPTISRATVYRNLAVLSEAGEITRVKVPQGADHYDYRHDAHYHGVCRLCGAVCDVEAAAADDLSSYVGDTHGFVIDGHSLMFSGLCPDCAAKLAEGRLSKA